MLRLVRSLSFPQRSIYRPNSCNRMKCTQCTESEISSQGLFILAVAQLFATIHKQKCNTCNKSGSCFVYFIDYAGAFFLRQSFFVFVNCVCSAFLCNAWGIFFLSNSIEMVVVGLVSLIRASTRNDTNSKF